MTTAIISGWLRPVRYGLVLVVMAACGVIPSVASASSISILNNGDFEGAVLSSALRTSWNSSVYGLWAVGDPMAVVGSANGITPLGGAKMMDFSNTSGTSADVYQIIDLTAFATQIDAGLVTIDTAAYFNSVSPVSAGMALLGWSGAPTSFGGISYLHSGYGFTTDASKDTWQQFGYSGTIVPSGTRYLAFGLNVPTAAAQAYVDNASATLHINDGVAVVPEPASLTLLGTGLLAGFIKKRRQKANRL